MKKLLLILLLFLSLTIITYAENSIIHGGVDYPKDGQEIFLNAENNSLEGWVIYPNGIEKIEILINGNIIGRATYGEKRDDVNKAYPNISDSISSGFKYVFGKDDLLSEEQLISLKITPKIGNSFIWKTVKVKGTKSNIASGGIDTPDNNKVIGIFNNRIEVAGWVVDPNGVKSIDIFVDDIYLGEAEYGSTREDVRLSYSEIKDSQNSGFSFYINSKLLTSGRHIIYVIEKSKDGTSKLIGKKELSKISLFNFFIWLSIFFTLLYLLFKFLVNPKNKKTKI